MLTKTLAALSLILALGSASTAIAAETAPYSGASDGWSGFYAGVWGGYRLGTEHNTSCVGNCAQNVPLNGLTGGVDLGYDVKLDSDWVVGGLVVVPLIKPTYTATVPALPGATFTINPQWAVVSAVRAGRVMNNMMPYAFAGVGVANVTVEDDLGTKSNATHVGIVAGAGTEFKINDAWSLDARYMFGLAGEGQYNFCTGTPCPSKYTETSHNFSIGAHYRF